MIRILAILLLLVSTLSPARAITVTADATTGNLLAPLAFTNFIGATVTNKLTKTGDAISGTFAITNSDLTWDGDPTSPNTNWIRSIYHKDLDTFDVHQTKTVSIYGKENNTVQGGIVTINAITNLSFLTPNTLSIFFQPTNQLLLSITGIDDNGNPTADFLPLDSVAATNSTFAGKVAGFDSTTKKLTKGSVDITDVASAATLNTVSANLVTVSNSATYLPFKITASGLVATVGSGVLNFADGSSASVSQQTVNLTPSITNYIVIRLDTNHTAHALYRAIDSASVTVASVVAGASSVTSINQFTNIVIPPNSAYPINVRERLGLPVTDQLIGTSLTYGAGGSPMWFDLLYNPTYSGNGYNLPNRANITLTRKGQPGGTWTFGALMMSDTFIPGSPAFASWGFDHPNQCFATLPMYNNGLSTSYAAVGVNPYVAKSPGRVVIEFGTNYDVDQLEKVEAQACYWQRRGARVILVPGIQRYDGPSSANVLDLNWKPMADAHGFAIADWDAYYQEARNTYLNFSGTNPTSGDNVHPSTFGQTILAGDTGTVLCPVNFQSDQPFNPNARRILYTNVLSAPHAQACYTYTTTSGTSTAATAYASDCPAVVFGGISSGSAITSIPNGAYVGVSFPCVAGAVYGIFENQSGENCTFTTTVQSSPQITASSVTGATLPFQIVPLMSRASVQAAFATNGFYSAFANKGIPVGVGFRFNVTSGTAKLVGIIFETPTIEQVPLSSLVTSGGGAYYDETSDVDNGSRTVTTDSIGNRIGFTANDCNGLMLLLRTGNQAGTIAVETDGIVANSSFDTYANTASRLLLPIVLFPGAWPDSAGSSSAAIRLDNNFGTHSMKIKLTGTNASCSASTAGARLLTVNGAFKLKMQ